MGNNHSSPSRNNHGDMIVYNRSMSSINRGNRPGDNHRMINTNANLSAGPHHAAMVIRSPDLPVDHDYMQPININRIIVPAGGYSYANQLDQNNNFHNGHCRTNVVRVNQNTPYDYHHSQSQSNQVTLVSNYRGKLRSIENNGEGVREDDNCCLNLSNLPPTCTVGDLLGAIRGVGRVSACNIRAPDGRFHTSAAKLSFFTRQEAETMMVYSRQGHFMVNGYVPRVGWNKHRMGPQLEDVSRLCVGARVMLTQNIAVAYGLVNGALGTVEKMVWQKGVD
ncbi:hypothetical protein F4778DRAFT_779309 [Xylariomycetidae sp. FL2044]|nr:hypothetical protein F4778DRAFT_779309 [Xylariomycetidae sp. FL2044]